LQLRNLGINEKVFPVHCVQQIGSKVVAQDYKLLIVKKNEHLVGNNGTFTVV
jgi:hypothetical protein